MNTNKKYKLTQETILSRYGSQRLYRIRALRDFGNVKKGELGGFVGNEQNLSHEGDCWVYDNACVFDNAVVKDNAKLFHNALVFGDAIVMGNAEVKNKAQVYNNAKISDWAIVYGSSEISGNARISSSTLICDAEIGDNALISEQALDNSLSDISKDERFIGICNEFIQLVKSKL